MFASAFVVKNVKNWGQHSTVVAFMLPDPAAPGSIPGIPKFFSEKKLSMLPRLNDSAAA